MPLNKEETKRRISAARLLRNLSQDDVDALGAADGFGKGEMSRVERGELDFRAGKHLDPFCRYLRVPRWWLTADELDFGGIDAPPSPDEVSSLLAQQNVLLARQAEILARIEAAQHAEAAAVTQLEAASQLLDESAEKIRRLGQEIVDGDPPEDQSGSPQAPPKPAGATS